MPLQKTFYIQDIIQPNLQGKIMAPGIIIIPIIAVMKAQDIILTKRKRSGGISGVCLTGNVLVVDYGFKISK